MAMIFEGTPDPRAFVGELDQARPVLDEGVAVRHPGVVIVLALLVAVVAHADLVAAGVLLVGSAALWFVLRRRGRRRVWATTVGIVAGVTAVGVVAALAVPTYHAGRDPLRVPTNPMTAAVVDVTHKSGTFELNGYVVSDNDNAASAVDSQAPNLSTISATGGLVNPDGTFLYVPARNALVHVHLGGARAQLVAQADNPPSLGYELAALAAQVDVVQLMTYDQNDPTSSPGPVGSTAWVEAAVASALRRRAGRQAADRRSVLRLRLGPLCSGPRVVVLTGSGTGCGGRGPRHAGLEHGREWVDGEAARRNCAVVVGQPQHRGAVTPGCHPRD